MKFKRKGNFHVYIVQCIYGTYYTGSTKNLEERIKLHNKGNGAKYLRKNQGHPFYLPLLTFIWRQPS